MFLTGLAFLILFVAAKSGGDQTFLTDAGGQFLEDAKGEFQVQEHRVSPFWLIAAYMRHLAGRADAQSDGPVAGLEGRPGRGCAA